MKHSQKRDKILAIFKNGDLLTANEVCARLEEIDRATVYRNLDLFSKEGILRKVNVKEGISSYELAVEGDSHQHFVCTNCEKIYPVEVDINKIKAALNTSLEFVDLELNLKGECFDCKD